MLRRKQIRLKIPSQIKIPPKSRPKTLERKQELFLAAYASNLYNVSESCRASGIKRELFYYWTKHDIDFLSKVNKVHEDALDSVESHYFKTYVNPQSPKTTARTLQWYMEKKATHRGYSNRQVIEHQGDPGMMPVSITFVRVETPEQVKQAQGQVQMVEKKEING